MSDTVEALKIGMETEKRGLETYLDLAHRTEDITGKNMFIILARDELSHFEILEKAMAQVDAKGAWAEIKVRPSLIEEVLPRLRDRDVRTKGAKGIDQADAIRAAMDQERASAELYRRQTANSTDPEAREVFRKLMEMEEAHYDILSAELDSISSSGFWFEIPEFNLEVE